MLIATLRDGGYIVPMDETYAVRILSALGSPTRMRVFAILCGAGEAGMASGDLADACGVPPNLMSSHLSVLQRAGIVTGEKTGRLVIYKVVQDPVLDLAAHLRDLVPAEGASRHRTKPDPN